MTMVSERPSYMRADEQGRLHLALINPIKREHSADTFDIATSFQLLNERLLPSHLNF
jgi:hypothetical protein